MNWLYTFGKDMTVTDQHKKYWHITDYTSDEAQKKGYIVDTLDATNPDASTFLKRNTEYKVGTIEQASFNWADGTVSIKRYEEIYKLVAPVITLNGSTTTQYTLKIENTNPATAPVLAPTATLISQNFPQGQTYDIKPGESITLDYSWSKDEDIPESITYKMYFSAYHCTDSDLTEFTAVKQVVPKDLVCEATCTLDQSTGAFKSIYYKISNPNDYVVLVTGQLKLDNTILEENFDIPALGYISATKDTDGYKLTLDGTLSKKND